MDFLLDRVYIQKMTYPLENITNIPIMSSESSFIPFTMEEINKEAKKLRERLLHYFKNALRMEMEIYRDEILRGCLTREDVVLFFEFSVPEQYRLYDERVKDIVTSEIREILGKYPGGFYIELESVKYQVGVDPRNLGEVSLRFCLE